MYQAEALADLNDGQYGSRPRRNATDPVFIEELRVKYPERQGIQWF